MSFKIVRNDITKMNTEAIVNTANELPTANSGCDLAVYKAAGYDELLSYRKEHIGRVPEGEVFITPGFNLKAKYIIHAVSPYFTDGKSGEEEKLRGCYRKSLELALEKGITSIAFPLISTGSFGYPKEEGMRIAVDEIHAFLMKHTMEVYLVVFDKKTTGLAQRISSDLETYIDENYVDEKVNEEYSFHDVQPMNNAAGISFGSRPIPDRDVSLTGVSKRRRRREYSEKCRDIKPLDIANESAPSTSKRKQRTSKKNIHGIDADFQAFHDAEEDSYDAKDYDDEIDDLESRLSERMKHLSDTFSEYLLFLIKQKGLTNAEVYNRAIVDKKVFSKIKNNPDYHPKKITALCLCIGAELNLDESKDLLQRAGYALSPCDKTDIIFSYFIEHGIYDMIELDIQLEEHGEPCVIE